jgi:phage tail-like protein
MPPNHPNPHVYVEVTADQVPTAWDMLPLGVAGQRQTEATQPILLQPERPNSLYLRIHNLTDESLELNVEVTGDYPATWQHYSESNSRSLEPRQQASQQIIFQIPSDYFEDQAALTNQELLPLDFPGEITIIKQDANRAVWHRPIHLFVRPKGSYTAFLPEIYQQTDFVNRFISIFEASFDTSVQTMESFWAYLNPLTAPAGMISFLAEWVAWPLDARLPLKIQRRLVRHAMEIYQWRGSRRGLQFVLHLCTGLPFDDDHISIIENHDVDFVVGEIALADGPMLGGGQPFHFSVTLRPTPETDRDLLDEALLRSIIEREKPAFCTYDLSVLSNEQIEQA